MGLSEHLWPFGELGSRELDRRYQGIVEAEQGIIRAMQGRVLRFLIREQMSG
jgi:hypothetical protein